MTNHEKFLDIVNSPSFKLAQAEEPDSQLDAAIEFAKRDADHAAGLVAAAVLVVAVQGPASLQKFVQSTIIAGATLQPIHVPTVIVPGVEA